MHKHTNSKDKVKYYIYLLTICINILFFLREMNLLILDPFPLHLQQRFRNDIFAREAHTPQDINKSLRHSAYRQYILWVHGRLHREDRRVVPSCCVKAIRRRFPDPTGQYKGFVPAFGVGWWTINGHVQVEKTTVNIFLSHVHFMTCYCSLRCLFMMYVYA